MRHSFPLSTLSLFTSFPLFFLFLKKLDRLRQLLCFLTALCLLPIAYCQSSYWQQRVNYNIDVTLNDADNSLNGFEKIEYINNSPDTLYFIWFHVWPNAYKNDRTAFSDQLLENGSTKFYFSDNDQRGYINRLDFKINGITAKTEDHPQHQDIIKVVLPVPLPPAAKTMIETPFHVKLPFLFSRTGYEKKAYAITQWYPKPAVYDRKGWHPMPYLDQGEFYSEFGDYDVQLHVPATYKVAATGEQQNIEGSSLHYIQKNVHDFAWFADKDFKVVSDTLKLPSGKIIKVAAYYYPTHEKIWKNCIRYIKNAVLTKSHWVGEYPYNVVTVVDGGNGGGMEYPTITLLQAGDQRGLDFVIDHEVGHNWFCEILASNEREHAWMDEGMNTYYDQRYASQQYPDGARGALVKAKWLQKKLPGNTEETILQTLYGLRKDQPIETPSEKFNILNYNLVAYTKTGDWMKQMEQSLGQRLFDSVMQNYYRQWSFKHPYPEDFKTVVENVSRTNLDAQFSLLNRKGEMKRPEKKDIRFTWLFNLKETDKHNYISVFPMIGYNFYDKQMLGAIIHNYQLPLPRLKFLAIPLYSSKTKQMNGIGRIGYTWMQGNNGAKAELSIAGETFTMDSFSDTAYNVKYLRFYKVAPALRYTFANKNPRSAVTKYVQWKTYLIGEQSILFTRDTVQQIDLITYPTYSRYVNQLRFVYENNRVLYPYKGVFQLEQGEGWARAEVTANYFFNYPKSGGVDVRFFAGKFFYLGDRTFYKQFQTDPYHLNMTGPKGYEDYTYSNYFYGRNEYQRYPSQQIMIRDGGFKVRTDLLSDKIGKTDDWLAAVNLTSSIPKQINPLSLLPVKLPVKAFLDVGTYADAWKKNAATGKFLYDAGVQLSLFKNVLNIYIPLLYSKVYADYFKSTITDLRFVKNIAFSIDIQNINFRRYIPQFPF